MSFRPRGMAMRQRSVRRGFTLVELLIAMALTLILVYAVARFFSFVGETVRDGRAQTEMGGQLRAAFLRLQQDFSELTVRVGGRIDAGSGMGCLELWEGIASDSDPNGDGGDGNADGVIDDTTNFLTNDLGDPNSDGKPDGPMLGDCDDILVMTVRSQGEPYVGRQFTGVDANGIPQYAVIRSNLAEVIWFTSFKDVNLDGVWQMTEPRYLVRRQLLIRPDLTVSAPNPLAPGQNFFHHNDISCHVVLNSSGVATGFAANSLADLSQRENRFVHLNLTNYNQNGLIAAQNYMPNVMQLNVGLCDVPSIPLYQQGSCSVYSLDGILQFHGEDKVLSNVIAFDMRVYDPYAALRADNSDVNGSTGTTDDDAQGVLAPGDAGYAVAILSNPQFPVMGNGAYVDLWYTRAYRFFPAGPRTQVLLGSNSAYSWAPNARNYPGGAIWDTWTTAYEKDGVQQVPPPYVARAATATFPAEDWMVNGNDDDGIGGVDDPGEAETAPPYPVYIGENGQDDNFDGTRDDAVERDTNVYARPIPTMLRGIEVRIRMYEPGTRQTRQATVHTDFIPE